MSANVIAIVSRSRPHEITMGPISVPRVKHPHAQHDHGGRRVNHHVLRRGRRPATRTAADDDSHRRCRRLRHHDRSRRTASRARGPLRHADRHRHSAAAESRDHGIHRFDQATRRSPLDAHLHERGVEKARSTRWSLSFPPTEHASGISSRHILGEDAAAARRPTSHAGSDIELLRKLGPWVHSRCRARHR